MTFCAFGCALDVLDAPEKMAMKLAYINAVRQGLVASPLARDPYELLMGELEGVPGLVSAGRLEIEEWLTPRPGPGAAAKVDAASYREFLDSGGCEQLAERVRRYARDRVLPLDPLLIGVDHSLTGGVLSALRSGGEGDLGLVVLDSHLDAIPASVRRAALQGAGDRAGGGDAPDVYSCGSWILGVLERGDVAPENVVVLGPSELPDDAGGGEEAPAMEAFRREYQGLLERGVKIISRRRVRSVGPEAAAAEAAAGLECSSFYLSIDADIGAGEAVGAVRFLDTIGLEADEVVALSAAVAREGLSRGMRLAGLDMMEMDVHLADVPGSGDRTLEMCAAAVRAVLSEAARREV